MEPTLDADLHRRGWLTRVPEYLALLAIGVIVVVTWEGMEVLPERIPTHFGAAGRPDGWGPRSMFWIPSGVALGTYAMLSVIQRYPRSWNYPVRVTEENRARLELVMLGLVRWVKAEILVLFAYLQWATVQVGTGAAAGLSNMVMFGAVGTLLATTLFFVVWARRVA